MNNKNITINDLAAMVQKGFNGVDSKFEQVYEDFGLMKKQLDRIEKSLIEEQNRRIERLEMRIDYLENMLNTPSKRQ